MAPPIKRPRTTSQLPTGSKPPPKKTKTAKKQQLISRFFATGSSPRTIPSRRTLFQPATTSTTSPTTSAAPTPQQSQSPVKTTKLCDQPRIVPEILQPPQSQSLPSTIVDDASTERSPSPPTTRLNSRQSARPRIRKLIDLESDEDEPSPCKQTAGCKNDDPDFEDGDINFKDLDDNSDNSLDIEADADPENDPQTEINSEEEQNSNVGSQGKSRDRLSQSVTLTSYALSRGASSPIGPLPRDEKRRKRLTDKVGRMEAGKLFQRRSENEKQADAADELRARRSSELLSKGIKKKGNAGAKYTPLEAQYVALRDAHPGLVLVVECGYKYRLFDTDAATASSVLRIVSYFDHNFLTASFPTHRLAHHVRRLVDAGFKVGVVAQAETAALKRAGDTASKLFQRTLSAVYSKGTIVADGTLITSPVHAGPTPASYIMALCDVSDAKAIDKDRVGIAFAAVDCATGEVLYDAFIDDILRSDLEARLVAVEPVEVIVPELLASKRTESVIKAYCETSSARVERMENSQFATSDEIASMNEAIEKGMHEKGLMCSAVLSCLGVLTRYLKQFKLELSIKTVSEYKSFRSRRYMKIGADVLRNFEVFGNSNTGTVDGSLIGLVNRTKTAFGSRQMRQWLSHPLTNADDINDRLDAVAYLRHVVDGADSLASSSDADVAVAELAISLGNVPDLEQGLTRISCGKSSPSELVRVLTAIEEVGRKTDYIKSLNPGSGFPRLLKKLFENTPLSTTILEDHIVEVLFRDAAMNDERHKLFEREESVANVLDNVEGTTEFVDTVEEVKEAKNELEAAEKAMDKLLKKLRERYSSPKWEWKKVAQDEYLLEVPTNKAGSMPRSWTIISQTKAVKRFRPDEAVSGYDRVLCAREMLEATCTRCWDCYLKVFAPVASRLRAMVRTLVDLDCLAALGRVANHPGYCRPKVCSDSDGGPDLAAGIRAVDARHALSEMLPSCRSYVPNDVKLGTGGDEAKAVVISGPNYGGKSSYARMTALLVIMAQIGSFVPATSVSLRPFDAIFARMGAADCMAKGMSSLMVELAETSRILHAATRRSLVVLDELGRGTSTHDGSAIAYATLAHLVGEVRCSTLFVTHYPMIASLRHVFKGEIDACYMDYQEDEDVDGNGGDDCKAGGQHVEMRSRRKKITLLYKLTKGVATSSYGVNVARLAGLDAGVLDEALQRATALESKMEQARRNSRFANLLTPEAWRNDNDIRKLLKDGGSNGK